MASSLPRMDLQSTTSGYLLPQSTSRRDSVGASPIQYLSLIRLRSEIRQNRVSFPSQVPTFSKHDRPDLQRKVVQLYFLFGWSCSRIAHRYGVLRQRIQQILSTWKRRAIETGYLQEIPPASGLPHRRAFLVTSSLVKIISTDMTP